MKTLWGIFLFLAVTAHAETFRFRLIAEPETLDWNRAQTPVETYIVMNLMEGLVGFDDQFKINPVLAEKWSVSADGKTYRFSIRKNILWSDGVELKASHFVDSWKRLLTPETAAAYAYFLYDVVGAEEFNGSRLKDFSQVGIKALSDYELEVKLRHPVAYWIYIPTFWVTFPIREDLILKQGKNWLKPGNLVTLGPFLLKSHQIDSKIEFEKNPLYSKELGFTGNISKVVGITLRDDTTAMNLFETGRLDFLTDIATTDLKYMQNRKELKSFPYLKTGYLGFISTHPSLSNVHFRKAIAHSIDRSRFSEILFGKQTQANSFVPPPLKGSFETVGIEFDPKKAKEEFALVPESLKKNKIKLLISSGEKQITTAQYLQAQIKEHLNYQIEIENFDHKTFRAQLKQKEHALFLLSWSADYPDADNFVSMFLSSSGNNYVKNKDPEYDAWVMKARQSKSENERILLYEKIQKRLLEQSVMLLPLYYEPNLALLRGCIQGLTLSPLNTLMLKKVNACHP